MSEAFLLKYKIFQQKVLVLGEGRNSYPGIVKLIWHKIHPIFGWEKTYESIACQLYKSQSTL